ncbi:hypothetical protein BC828DRAFT_378033, partial [Blastocladiella britannica]
MRPRLLPFLACVFEHGHRHVFAVPSSDFFHSALHFAPQYFIIVVFFFFPCSCFYEPRPRLSTKLTHITMRIGFVEQAWRRPNTSRFGFQLGFQLLLIAGKRAKRVAGIVLGFRTLSPIFFFFF